MVLAKWSSGVSQSGAMFSSGGKNRLGNISKQGDRYLRNLFVAGALAVIRQDPRHQASALAHGFAGAAADEDRSHRAANKLARMDGQGRALQVTRRACGVTGCLNFLEAPGAP
jgi:hypothetical protein